jgi:5-methylcytosine-specific restriction protein B
MLDYRLREWLTKTHENLLQQGTLLSSERLSNCFSLFRAHFGLEVLKKLDGEELLNLMHARPSKDSLVYWLEFKNDDEFPAKFGSIAGGSALKFGFYWRQETGAWMTGSPLKQVELSPANAIALAKNQRDQLVVAADLLEKLPQNASDPDYLELQNQMDQRAPDVSAYAWGHKYLSLLYPSKLDDYHNPDFQRFYLIKLLQTPPPQPGLYAAGGRFVQIAGELGIPINHLTTILNQRYAKPRPYWRIGTSLGEEESIWPLMKNGCFVAIGWATLGNLAEGPSDQDLKEIIRQRLEQQYKMAPNVASRKAGEIRNFVEGISDGDLVLAADGKRILGVGRVTGGYQFDTASEPDAPHRRPVEWLSLEEWELPVPEGLRTTVVPIKKDVQNLIEIERRLLDPKLPPPTTPESKTPRGPKRLDGVPGRIQSILDRKKQAILYGPPGTGKTYWAHRTARDLAALTTFGHLYDELQTADQAVISGNDTQRGLVRFTTFHPAYGYEDFIEGYRPSQSATGHLLFALANGIFKQVCQDATKQPARNFYLIIDEINRGDIPRIFGELLTLLESDKRDLPVWLPLSGDRFTVPRNIFVIGTMNTADRSIALLDTALRRRFGFVELMPKSSELGDAVVAGAIPLGPWLAALNERIRTNIGRDARNLQIGHAYLFHAGKPVTDFARFCQIMTDDILPLLEEYCYDNYDTLKQILEGGLLDEAKQRIRYELFTPENQEELVQALLALAPDVTASPQAAALTQPVQEPEEAAEEDDPAK